MGINHSRRNPKKPEIQEEIDKVAEKLEQEASEAAKKVASRIPVPCGYKILIALPQVDEMTEGGIIKATETKRIEEIGSVCGFVIKMGPDCYADKKRFPSGAYCKEGDWVMMRSYSGTRFAIDGEECRLINDDSVEGTVQDPRGIARV